MGTKRTNGRTAITPGSDPTGRRQMMTNEMSQSRSAGANTMYTPEFLGFRLLAAVLFLSPRRLGPLIEPRKASRNAKFTVRPQL